MLTFRLLITVAVMTFVVALTALLIAILARSLRLATNGDAARPPVRTPPARMGAGDGSTANFPRFSSLVHVLATSSSVADLERRGRRPAAPCPCSRPLCRNCHRWTASMPASKTGPGCRCGGPATSERTSANGYVRRRRSDMVISLIRLQRPRRGAKAAAAVPGPTGQRRRGRRSVEVWLRRPQTPPVLGHHAGGRPYVSVPGTSLSASTRACHHGQRALPGQGPRRAGRRPPARHVQRIRPGPRAGTERHGHDLRPGGSTGRPSRIFRSSWSGSHRRTRPGRHCPASTRSIPGSRLPSFGGLTIATSTRGQPSPTNQGRDYLFRLTKFALGEGYSASILLLAAQDDFVQNVRQAPVQWTRPRDHSRRGLCPAGLVVRQPNVSFPERDYGAGAQAPERLAEPSLVPVTSHIKEIHELGSTVHLAQRAIASFARFVPKEIVRRVIDNSISPAARRRQTGDHAGLYRRPGIYHDRGIGRSRCADAADVTVFLRADGSVPH